ncbi:hypothetical protein [Telmatospirillum sp.]|uniref:hypothetical protein n=1 Tax=Telmatospirillum sp. TaxID=2079197 RepID=UPI0028457979|nr:hypothetical protein [Telmatospirillum sp.]MDR3439482.1 hypothetical protein [Telmatospirillum sp.]
MKRAVLAILLVMSSAATAQVPGILKPGLWSLKPIGYIVDGKDIGAEMAARQAKLQESLAKLPPDQRKRMEGKRRPAIACSFVRASLRIRSSTTEVSDAWR